MRAFQVLQGEEVAIRAPKPAAGRAKRRRLVVALLLATAGAGYWPCQLSDTEPVLQTAVLALPNKPSVAVLPFQDLSL